MEPALGRHDLLIALALVAIVVVAFAPVTDDPFIRLDDYGYVVDNTHIHDGPTPQALAWAWTAFEKANWHPLTWWSHMIDYRLYGADAGGHHRTNLFLHILNALVLFAVLRKITAARWRSALVAALFAVHPLHVETVAWISERKDVLSTLFGLLAIGAYAGWTRKAGLWRYATALVLFAASLASKPMLVTLPLLLLLIDYWPLQRSLAPRLIVEKVPFLMLSALSSVLTVAAQRAGGAFSDMTVLPLSMRAANAAISYWRYIARMFWPKDLSIFYTYQSWTPGQIAAATIGLIAVTWLVFAVKRRWAVTGWLAYLGMLVPVIGLVQVGRQSMADRYTYLPLIGLFILLAWGLEELCAGRRRVKFAVVALAMIAVAASAVGTRKQVGYWKDSVTLFEHGLQVSPESLTLHNNLGIERSVMRQWDRAEHHFVRAREIEPNSPEAYFNLGRLLVGLGRTSEAIENLERAVEIHPERAASHFHLAIALRSTGRSKDIVRHFREAARLDSTWVAALNQAAWLLATSADASVRDPAEALRLAERASRLTGYGDANTLDSLSAALAASGQFEQAIETVTRAERIATAQGNSRKADTLRRRLESYRNGLPWITP